MNKLVGLPATVLSIALSQSMMAQPRAPQNPDDLARARVNAAMQHLEELPFEIEDEKQFAREENARIDRIQSEIDAFVTSRIRPSTSSQGAEGQLRRLLSDHKPEREYSSEPFVRTGDLTYGRSLVAAYSLMHGPHNDVATIRAYREAADGTLRFVSKSTEFEGLSMKVWELRSPLSGEIWFLLWGRGHTANGSWIHLKALAFDGRDFRVLWRPEAMDNAEVEMTKTGFAVTHHRRDVSPQRFVRDEYTITANGPLQVSP